MYNINENTILFLHLEFQEALRNAQELIEEEEIEKKRKEKKKAKKKVCSVKFLFFVRVIMCPKFQILSKYVYNLRF